MTTPLSATLRIATGLILLSGAVYAGVAGYRPVIVPALGVAFTLSFIVGRIGRWQLAFRSMTVVRLAAAFASTFAVQIVLVGLLYLIGMGLAALFAPERMTQPVDETALARVGGLGVFGAVAGLLIHALERRAQSRGVPSPGAQTGGALAADLVLLDEPVTPETFFSGIHWSHGTYDENGFVGTPNEHSAGSDAKIAEAEARLGVELPDSLRALYRVQNGGSLSELCIPLTDKGPALQFSDVLTPFSGHNDLRPTEWLESAWDTFLSFGDPEDKETYGPLFSNGTDRMIVLSQWYRETLFLDYNLPGEPRVGFVDFDTDDWTERVHYWPDFSSFYGALRRFTSDF